MDTEQVKVKAAEFLAELRTLETGATNQRMRQRWKSARNYLERAESTGDPSALRLGSHDFAVVRHHIQSVRTGKEKGRQRALRRAEGPSE